MPDADGFAPGTPSWVDLSSQDVDESTRFYEQLFGWVATEPGPVEQTGGYRMFLQRGRTVAGAGPQFQPGAPATWNTYITVGDADATTQAALDNGGQVVMAPVDVLDAGRMAVLRDPQGAFFSLWEPRAHRGAQIVNEPVSLAWNELVTTDADGARAFYVAVFGWMAAGDQRYTMLELEGRRIAGLRPKSAGDPEGVPPHWLASFAVADPDATAAACRKAGGSVAVPPMDIPPVGRFAILSDPQGARFGIIRLDAPQSP